MKNNVTETELCWFIHFAISAEPFVTKEGDLTKVLQKVIENKIKVKANLSTTGGTSDARFISTHANETIEFGPLNSSAHKINENIKIDDLIKLEDIYYGVLSELLL